MAYQGGSANSVPVEVVRFQTRGIDAALSNRVLAEYAASAGLFLTHLDDSDDLRVRTCQFRELAFADVRSPRAQVTWSRALKSRSKILIVVCTAGTISIRSSAPVLFRAPGLFLIPPGDAPVDFELEAGVNELLYISAPASVALDLDLDRAVRPDAIRGELPARVLTPLYAFASTLSAASSGTAVAADPLRSAALEVARALARLIVESDTDEGTLFRRTQRLIGEVYADARLSVARLARMAGVSERRLQTVFAAEGTSVAKELRATRTRAAQELRRTRPDLPAQQIATASGFGSVSSFYRALEAQNREPVPAPAPRSTGTGHPVPARSAPHLLALTRSHG